MRTKSVRIETKNGMLIDFRPDINSLIPDKNKETTENKLYVWEK